MHYIHNQVPAGIHSTNDQSRITSTGVHVFDGTSVFLTMCESAVKIEAKVVICLIIHDGDMPPQSVSVELVLLGYEITWVVWHRWISRRVVEPIGRILEKLAPANGLLVCPLE